VTVARDLYAVREATSQVRHEALGSLKIAVAHKPSRNQLGVRVDGDDAIPF
jgi:hypothetical protein